MPTEHSYPRGSEWRKWDLHLHSPGTKKNDGYHVDQGDPWDEYCRRLEESDVAAFGVTDYFSVDGYANTIDRFRVQYPHSTKQFFPNIELCTTDVVNRASEEVNLHLLFNPQVPLDRIREFIRNLQTSKTGDRGRALNASELQCVADYEGATTTRELILNALHVTFGDKGDLTELLLIIAAVNSDGIRPQRGIKRKAVLSDELDKFANAFFGNSHNSAFYLNPSRLESGERVDPKPVVTGSDSHSFEDLDARLGKLVLRGTTIDKEPTWIKANTTFEGLRQILFEPAGRVFIGEEPPVRFRVRENQRNYLESLAIDQVAGYTGRFGSWFKDERVPLSAELVAIIGNKGSGKSAVTDILGLLGNSHNQMYERAGKSEALFSFLNREKFLKGGCATHFNGTINWYSGDPDTRSLDSVVATDLPERVEYLPQKYLEKICANIDDDEFRHKLNEVIFGYVPEEDRFRTSTLDDLVAYLSTQEAEEIAASEHALHLQNELIVQLERKVTVEHRNELQQLRKLKEEEIKAHLSTKPLDVAKPAAVDASNSDEIAGYERILKDLEERARAAEHEKTILSKRAEDLRQARQAIEREAKALGALERQFQNLFHDAGITYSDVVKVSTNFIPVDTAIRSAQERVNQLVSLLSTPEEIARRGLSQENSAIAESASLQCQRIAISSKRAALVEQLDKPNRDYQGYLLKLEAWKAKHVQLTGEGVEPVEASCKWLDDELSKVTGAYMVDLAAARARRREITKEILSKRKQLVTFYLAIKQSIDREIEAYAGDLRDYAISIDASLRLAPSFHDEFFGFINQLVKGSFHGVEEGRAQLKTLTDNVGDWQDEATVLTFLDHVVELLDSDKRGNVAASDGKKRNIFRQLKDRKDPVLFYDFLFGLGYLHSKYDLKVDGKDLSELSPGERGGLLLVFYLMLDRRDTPLIIDQPEDNLDNKSVYEVLVTFLKKAKGRRQIIIATHNPNLAVVADAEQIIHVSIDKRGATGPKNDFSFVSGAIEDPTINKVVIDILEGTLPAFDNRRLKYRRQGESITS